MRAKKTSARRQWDVRVLLGICAILALAVLVRVWNLDKESLWFDEWGSLWGISQPTMCEGLACQTQNNDNVPLYFVLQYYWAQCVGHDYTLVRLLSITFGVLSVALLFCIGRALHSNAAGLMAALLLAISPFAIRYSQELRPYALVLFLSLLSMYAILHLLREDRVRWWAFALAANLLLMWTHLFGFWLILLQGVLLVLLRRDRMRRIALWTGAHVLLMLPILLLVLSWDTIGQPPLHRGPRWLFLALFFMDTYHLLTMPRFGLLGATPAYARPLQPVLARIVDIALPSAWMLAALCLLLLLSFALRMALQARRAPRGGAGSAIPKPQATLLLLWFIGPGVMLLAFSHLVIPAFQSRYIIYCLPALYLIVSISVLTWRARLLRWAGGGLLVALLGCFTVLACNMPLRPDYKGASRYILSNRMAEDRMVFHPKNPAATFRAISDYEIPFTEFNRFADALFELDHALEGHGQAWFLITPWNHRDAVSRSRTLEQYCTLRGIRWDRTVFPGLWDVYVYRCFQTGDFTPLERKAAKALLRASQDDPGQNALFNWIAARAATDSGRWQEAAEICERLLAAVPEAEGERRAFEAALLASGWHHDIEGASQLADYLTRIRDAAVHAKAQYEAQTRGKSTRPLFRLDDNLGEAVVLEQADLSQAEHTRLVLWPADEPLTAGDETSRVEVHGDVLHFVAQGPDGMTTAPGSEVYGPSVGAVVIDMQVKGTERVYLSWRPADTYWDWCDTDGNLLVPIRVERPGQRCTYVIPVSKLPGWQHRRVEALRLLTREAADIRLHGFRLRRRKGLFAQASHGVRKYRIGNETRPCLYMWTPGALCYDVTVPPGAQLTTGLGVVEPDAPADVTIAVQSSAGTSTFPWHVADRARWMDLSADLSAHAGQQAKITIQAASGDRAQVVLLSNPALTTAAGAYLSTTAPYNILFYVVDSLRADHLPMYGYGRSTAPRLQALETEGTLFERCFTQETCTKPSMATFSTGVDASVHGLTCICAETLGDLVQLPELLRQHGYVTGAVTENLYAPPEVPDRFTYSYLYDLDERTAAASGETLDRICQFLTQAGNRPFFLYVHTMECHVRINESFDLTYQAPGEFAGRWADHAQPDNLDAYDETILFADTNLACVLAKLDALGLAQRTLVVFTADHGEGFGAHGGRVVHGYEPFNELIHVPLLMRMPGVVPAAHRVTANVQFLDLAPTLLDYAGLPPCAQFSGLSLRPLMENGDDKPFRDRPIFSYTGEDLSVDSVRSVILGDWKLLGSSGRKRTFNIARDPDETRDERRAHHERHAELSSLFDAHSDEFSARRAGLKEAQIPSQKLLVQPETVERLRALGYLGDPR